MAKRCQSLHKIHFIKICLLYVVALNHQTGIQSVVGSECGIVAPIDLRLRVADFRIGGFADEIKQGDWPFLVALSLAKTLKFFCGGTLISSKHVLTAAHCIQAKRSASILLPADIIVLLGKHDLSKTNERGVVQQSPTEIYVHPEWNVQTEQHDADIAILVLSDNVDFTTYIRAVCLPADDTIIDGNTIDVQGSVVGWGLTGNGSLANIPRHTVTYGLPALNCLTRNPNLSFLSSMRTFCAGGGKGSPDRGDSGGGFFVKSGSTWTQYGIISVLHTFAAHKFVVYTNVKTFKNWIVETVAKSACVIDEAKMKINLNCEFRHVTGIGYGCYVYDLNIQTENTEAVSFSGFHLIGQTDQHVDFIEFVNGTMLSLPDGIGTLFKNLKAVNVGDERTHFNTKFIRRSKLKHFENLVRLIFLENDIDMIDENSFWDLPNLETFQVSNNALKIIKERTFERNLQLRRVYLNSNQLDILPSNLFRNNLLLDIVVLSSNSFKTIDERTFESNTKLREVWLSFNQLESVPGNLFRNNLLLERVVFEHNSLKTIDGRTFESNTKLRKVWLSFNQLESVPRNLFRNNLLLEKVDFDYNALKTINKRTFETNTELREVWLNMNQLESIPVNLFRNNLLLDVVVLFNNSFKTIDERTFESNTKLREVWLSFNQLESLPRNLFRNNLLLQKVDFRHNYINTIEIDFSVLWNATLIDFYQNICINAKYTYSVVGSKISKIYNNHFNDLTEFTNLIRANCSSQNP